MYLAGRSIYALDSQHSTLQHGQALFFREQQQYSVAINSAPITRGLCIDLDLSMVLDPGIRLLLTLQATHC